MKDIGKKVAIIGQILFYVMAAITIYQIIKKLAGGSWAAEEVILSFVVVNLTMTFGLAGYIIHMTNTLNNKISNVDRKIHGHIEWHKGKDIS